MYAGCVLLVFLIVSDSYTIHHVSRLCNREKAASSLWYALYFVVENITETDRIFTVFTEALDEGQNRMALQLITKLLKKTPDWPLVKVSTLC